MNSARLDFFALTSRAFSVTIRTEDADNLGLPFQRENDSFIITTAEQILPLQKAINNGDQSSIAAIFETRSAVAESAGYEETWLALESGHINWAMRATASFP